MPTDSAFDAARLEFKLVNQPIVSAKGSDLTKPLNEVCNTCEMKATVSWSDTSWWHVYTYSALQEPW